MKGADLINEFYNALPSKMREIRKRISRPLTLTEKILFSHLCDISTVTELRRGSDYAGLRPDRLAMQDATAQMSLLQFMLAGSKTSAIPASVHCDHLVVASQGVDKDLERALDENREVYSFLSSVCRKYGITFHEPGTGIIHQIVLENYAFPGGLMIGTDSHTPNAGGLGMLAIGVGGADAVDALTGMPWELRMPDITGVRLTGKLKGWCSPKDVILKITGMLSVKGGTGNVIEYFGDGTASLSCTGKATICNMGAETGATSSLFPFDQSMAAYLIATGREEIAELSFINREHLTADPEVLRNPEKYYNRVIEINLSELEPHINGPFSPDIAIPVTEMKKNVSGKKWPENVEVVLAGSCTNSSYEDLSAAASVIKDALSKKLKPKAQIIISPGSELVRQMAEKNGIMDLFRQSGALIMASACGPCIGQWKRDPNPSDRPNTIVHTFNRNFARRTDGNPDTHVFVTSPEIAMALAFGGKLTFNPLTDSLINEAGEKVMLDEPARAKLTAEAKDILMRQDSDGSSPDENAEIIIPGDSERLQLLTPFPEWDGEDFTNLFLLIKVKGKCTTDHISMAGHWLRYRGHLENISANYMLGAVNAFNNLQNSVLNQLTGRYAPVYETAKEYRNSGKGSVVVAEENFGEGSSREHAAMEARFLGVRAVVAKSFARIHETNLKKQGVLALTFINPADYLLIREDDRMDITGIKEMAPGSTLRLLLRHSDGETAEIPLAHSFNQKQIGWFRAGSALNLIRKMNMEK
ncbi:MAG: aconitate hydratase [Bacteroidales bacterium]|nr:aconitate hydratase [Bacteroidales bacterium]